MPSKPKNRVGEVYGKLTVVRISERRTKSGNAFWWCRCDCGREREVPGDKLSHNTSRKKPVVSACLQCSRELQIESVTIKNDRDEVRRREEAQCNRRQLQGQVPDSWLRLPLTDAHARELGQVLFFRGTRCLRNHLAPYRINGGCLACAGQKPSA
ncbi:early protein (E6) [Synechococcus sp. A10-1-5-9]|uniref:early protein (E6) n=1 Tax=Synechococcus sp. A10-1-5-9 TaxID=3392295 RepID=UPI0039E7DB24